MTEETAIEITDAPVEETERVYTQIEQEEMAKGWKPDGKKSAEEYRQYRDDYNNSLERIKAELQEQKKSVEYLTKQAAKNAQEGYEKALASLKKEQEDAALIGDVQTVTKVTDKIVELRKEQKSNPVEDFEKQPYIDFIARNKEWYVSPDKVDASSKQIAMSRYADRREEEIRLQNPSLSVPEVLEKLEEDIRSSYPAHFIGKSNTPSVVGKGQTISKTSNVIFDDLPDFHKQMIKSFRDDAKAGKLVFDEKAYIAALKLNNK